MDPRLSGSDALSGAENALEEGKPAPKYPYSRPHFLQFNVDELSVSADKSSRPIIVPRKLLPWNTGYAETVNAGKSRYNEDQACIYNGVLDYPKGTEHTLGVPFVYFGIFDGHAGTGAAVAAAKELHLILQQKLMDVLEYLFPHVNESKTRGNIFEEHKVSEETLIVGALETAFEEMDKKIGEDKQKYELKGGCTALVALFILGKLYVANAGDSRAIFCTAHAQPMPLSKDFTPERERLRIRKLELSSEKVHDRINFSQSRNSRPELAISSVRLKSISSGHRELNLVISELRDVRTKAKALAVSQQTASQDMLKWSLCEENQAIQDTFSQLSELNTLWAEAQREFAGPALAKQAVLRAKDQVRRCNSHAPNVVAAYVPINEGPPPPYSPTNHEVSHPYNPHYVPPASSADSECQSQPVPCSNPFMSSFQSVPNSSEMSRESSELSPQRSNPFESDAGATSNRVSCSNISSPGYSFSQDTDHTDHEDSLAEAVARMKT